MHNSTHLECIVKYIQHHDIMLSIFTALKILGSLSFNPFLTLKLLATGDLFTVSIVLPFPECHIVRIIRYMAFSDWLLSLGNMHLRFFHVFSWLDSLFVF